MSGRGPVRWAAVLVSLSALACAGIALVACAFVVVLMFDVIGGAR